jgi:hypothetical protein
MMPRQIDIPAQIIYETIVLVEESPNSWVRASVAKTNANGELLTDQIAQQYMIEGDNLTELLIGNPSWSPNKPAGTYDNEDLWHFIDLIRQS